MAGFTVHAREREGVTIHKDGKEIFLDRDECEHLFDTLKYAKKNYWHKPRKRIVWLEERPA